MDKVKVLLADDHQIVMEGLKGFLGDTYDIVGMANDGLMLIKEALRLQPDVIIADISMPSMNGMDAVKQIRKEGLCPKVIFLTMHKDAMYAREVLDAGAAGFVLKHSASSELMTAIEEALKGNTYISPSVSNELLHLYQNQTGPNSEESVLERLSQRQREVLQLLAEGKSAKEIAGVLNISTRTVEYHKYNTMEQLGINTNAGLIQFAIKNGIVSI